MKANGILPRAICLLGILLLPAARAQEVIVDLDPGQTKIEFVLHDVLHTVHGAFHAKAGHVAFDPAKNAITGNIVVDAASGDSGSGARDKRMTRDILEAQRYPEIRFTPKTFTGAISPSGASDVEVNGSFIIHGQAHAITIPMHLQASNDTVTATGKFLVPYVEWGMKNPSTFLLKVGDKVEVEFTAIGHTTGPHATAN